MSDTCPHTGADYVTDHAVNTWIDETTSASYTYYCEWPRGASTAEANARVCRLEHATGKSIWASGSDTWSCIVDDRASLTYA